MEASRQEQDRFDMLPFIAILMCTLGCLLFVTLSVAALSIGPGSGEGWIVGRQTGDKMVPVLVEWDGEMVTVHRDGECLSAAWGGDLEEQIRRALAAGEQPRPESLRLPDDGAFKKAVGWFYEHRRTHYALFAVRPSGFGSFDELADEFRSRGIKVGYEPITQGRPVVLLQGDSAHE